MTTSPMAARTAGRTLDVESDIWLRRLSGDGLDRVEAVEDLHALLLRATYFELGRRQSPGAVVGSVGVDDLATQAADDALVAILAKLHTYRGDSRFTTWAYKFALLEAAVKARRRPWHGRELPLEDDNFAEVIDNRRAPLVRPRPLS